MSVIDLKVENFESTIENNDIVILDFWAEWCGPCKQFAPTFEAVSEKHPDIVFAKVNVEEQQDLAGMFQVRSIPTLVFMREKIVVFSNPGVIPESNFEEGIAQLKELDMEKVRQDLAKAQEENA
ncbi:Putative thioredoxin 2 [Hydrogenovibrio crunogenus]|uniref:Thioredoxin n=1 Tax=Hydrogenovibrio crunogenus TaxID=39765 RepID=A0A4P7P0T2_9GAMM|nr:thioredoxin [Hydrogenovibrio crunogenus]QBZ83405.1 Putative thioredoxin 2 [Hydrogenovibrio crunogenus]